MKSLVRFFLQIIFGIDMIIAMIMYGLISYFFNTGWDWGLLVWSVFFAHAPDASMAIYPFVKNWVIKTFGIPSHRVLSHHPIIIIPLTLLFCFWSADFFGYPVVGFMILGGINVTTHFIHDSMEPHGMHWLSPFLWERITWHYGIIPQYVPKEVWLAIHLEKGKKYAQSSQDEFTQRAESVSKGQLTVWVIVATLLAGYFLIIC